MIAKKKPTFGTPGKTRNGFPVVGFTDHYGKICHLQESSLAICENADGTVDDPLGWIWLGIDDPEPMVMRRDAPKVGLDNKGNETGWMPYPLPPEVLTHTVMHLDEKIVRGLVERLQYWLKTGRVLTPEEEEATTE